jgi:dTDP-4-amino-4,6-dideoxygalactose transaminase
MSVPFVDLSGQHAEIADGVERDVLHVLRHGSYVGGHFLDRFERSLANYLDIDHVVGVSNGTDAIQLICEGLDIGKGDSVIVPNNSFIASAFGVSRAGAKPVLVDVNPYTYLIDYDAVEEKLKNNKRHHIKAVLAVNLYGQMPNMEALYELCQKHKVYLLEDAAQSIGATYQKKSVGYYSHAASTSFYPAKNLGGCGQGGAVITNDSALAKRIRIIANQGSIEKYEHICLGGNYRLDSIVAAQLFHALDRLDNWNDRRRAIANLYNEIFGIGRCPVQQPNSRHIYHLYEFKCESLEERNQLASDLNKNSIAYGYHYPNLIGSTTMYMGTHTPVAFDLKDKLISLPIFPTMTPSQVQAVIRVVMESCSLVYPQF